MLKKPLFIDRDGVINGSIELPDYLSRVEQFEFLPGTFEALQKLRDAGYEFFVMTNQAGIARGQASHAQLDAIHAHMIEKLQNEGIEISGVYMCPHRDEDNCSCRKPKPGLLLKAIEEHKLDPNEVIFIGDRQTDREAARAAGVRSVLIAPEKGLREAVVELVAMSRGTSLG